MTDCVVLGRDCKVDARRDQRDDSIFREHRRIEARSRVHVQIAANETGSVHDVPETEPHRVTRSGSDVDGLLVDGVFRSTRGEHPVATGGKRHRRLTPQSVDERTRTRGAVVRTEVGIGGGRHAVHDEPRGERRSGVDVFHLHVRFAAGQHVELELTVVTGAAGHDGTCTRVSHRRVKAEVHHRRNRLEPPIGAWLHVQEWLAFVADAPDIDVRFAAHHTAVEVPHRLVTKTRRRVEHRAGSRARGDEKGGARCESHGRKKSGILCFLGSSDVQRQITGDRSDRSRVLLRLEHRERPLGVTRIRQHART